MKRRTRDNIGWRACHFRLPVGEVVTIQVLWKFTTSPCGILRPVSGRPGRYFDRLLFAVRVSCEASGADGEQRGWPSSRCAAAACLRRGLHNARVSRLGGGRAGVPVNDADAHVQLNRISGPRRLCAPAAPPPSSTARCVPNTLHVAKVNYLNFRPSPLATRSHSQPISHQTT